jgi:DNA-binding response OmpR family regulator
MKVLLVEDQVELGNSISEYLSGEEIICETCGTCFDAEDRLLINTYDTIILDLMLPDGTGLDLLRFIKAQKLSCGVVIISAKNALDDKIIGLDLGADDYLTKPFHFSELSARLRSLYRRKNLGGNEQIAFNEYVLDPTNHTFYIHHQPLDLTKKEFELIFYFMTNKGRVLSRQAIVQHLWEDFTDDFANFDFVYQHIKNLRKKIIKAGGQDYIRTVHGIGYKFNTPSS